MERTYISIDSDDEILIEAPHLEQKPPRTKRKRMPKAAETDTVLPDQLPTPQASSEEDDHLPTSTAQKRTVSEGPDVCDTGESSLDRATKRPCTVQRQVCHVAARGPALATSAYQGWRPPAPLHTEIEADSKLRAALDGGDKSAQAGYTYLQLDDFRVYRPANTRHAKELVSLDRLTQDRFAEFRFDGILSVGEERCFVQDVAFQVLTIDGYGEDDCSQIHNQICIQSIAQSRIKSGAWYLLGRPASDYVRFYKEFLRLARFTRLFVNYLMVTKGVTLRHFRKDFYNWLTEHETEQGTNALEWLGIAERRLTYDFRTLVNANIPFLWKECYNIDDKNTRLCRHPIWEECDPQRLKAIPAQPNVEHRTVVTPYVYECFSSMYFGEQLDQRPLQAQVAIESTRRKAELRLTPGFARRRRKSPPLRMASELGLSEAEFPILVAAGDVVCFDPDAGTEWRHSQDTLWYAYVQRVRRVADRTLLDLLWLYESKDTTISTAYYPFPNELFLSDNCSCGKHAWDIKRALRRVDITWSPRNPYKEDGLFVRQKFRTVHEQDTYDFVTLEDSDFRCQCLDITTPLFEECCSKYTVGDTVLVRQWSESKGEDRLQPACITHFDHTKQQVGLRRMHRKCEVEPASAAHPNELLLSAETLDVSPSRIIRHCNVRHFSRADIAAGNIASPYNQDGTGDFFYVARHAAEDGPNGAQTADADNSPISIVDGFTPGWDPQAMNPQLIGMGIFCGGGSFDRGLEEGGAVRFRYAIDWAEHALHTHRANEQGGTHYFLGSVNDYLAQALAGQYAEAAVARPGDIHLCSAGNPCPGFSQMNNDRNSEDSRRNASMAASVVSFVDLYAPKYLLLENVVTMTQGMGPNKDQNVFSQIIAALVGLGYQVQQFLMDAWSYGSCQQRSRLFIIASAPGLKPLQAPPHSHAHPHGTYNRALGRSSNSLTFGTRRDEYTAFEHVTPAQACADLPDIGDAQPQLCAKYPDHRTATEDTAVVKARMAVVPVRPRGMGLMQAYHAGLLRGEPKEHCERVGHIRKRTKSTMFARIKPDFLFPTILTKLPVGDGISGRFLHWNEHRPATIMEARRAQGFPDHEVIVGTPAQQLKIAGNSVDRKVSLVLGLALRGSWMSSCHASIPNTPLVNKHLNRILPNISGTSRRSSSVRRALFEELEASGAQLSRVPGRTTSPQPETDSIALPQQKFYSNSGENRALSHARGAADTGSEPPEPASIALIDAVTPPTTATTSPLPEVTPKEGLDEPSEEEGAKQFATEEVGVITNRDAKIALHLTPEEIDEIKRDQFKAIRRILGV